MSLIVQTDFSNGAKASFFFPAPGNVLFPFLMYPAPEL